MGFGYEASLHEDVPLPDGGLPEPDARPGPLDRSRSGCSCGASGRGGLPLALLLVLGVLLSRRRRRRRRHHRRDPR